MTQFKFNHKPLLRTVLDPAFHPIILGNNAFKEAVHKTGNANRIKIAIERSKGQISTYETVIFDAKDEQDDANFLYIERLIKTLLWTKGGWKIIIGGSEKIGKQIKDAYQPSGLRAFDADFMSKIYQQDFEVEILDLHHVPNTKEESKAIGRHLDGYRIGFDAGGSDRKVSAVVNGVSIFSEEVVWHPKLQNDPSYHYDGIMDSIKRAASKMPRVDAIGVSSAGIYIDNKVSAASLFLKVPQDKFDKDVRNMYFRIQKEMGDVPIEVVNDGDVTALAGAMSLESTKILGIAMGTSEAAGYVDDKGNITGWLNELCFAPVDYNPDSMVDEWSNDYGCGVKYFSQDSVIKLAKPAGIPLDESLSPADKLKVVQTLLAKNDERAIEIFKTIGIYLGYSLAYYAEFYDISYVLVLGRVTSGTAGDIMIEYANNILELEFKELYDKITVTLPDEKSRRVGQSIAAASLPEL